MSYNVLIDSNDWVILWMRAWARVMTRDTRMAVWRDDGHYVVNITDAMRLIDQAFEGPESYSNYLECRELR